MKKIAARVFTVILSLILAGLIFVYFSPDYNAYVVRSESMRPSINMGDVVFSGPLDGPLSGELEVGSIVTYQRGSELITHRVLSIEGGSIVTKGDAVEDTDPSPISISNIAGTYLFRIPYLGYISTYARTKQGWFLVVVLPASILIGFLIREIQKELKKQKNQKSLSRG